MQEFSPAGTPQSLVFGKYAVLRRLAIGGMGEVFLARQTGVLGFDRLVILKSLLPELAEQEGFVEQFLDEARVVATLNHPNIVQTYEVGKHDGVYFIAMEYISGENLGRLQKLARKAERPMPVTVAVKVIHDAASGLDHAHKALDVHGRPLELVHRDISPQNIMVRGDGVTKVVDFGIAKASNRATRTATGTLKGKVQYMPPEQLNTEVLDHRCDQFALGVVLWELLTDEKLFGGNNELETIKNVLMAPIRKPSEVRPGLSAGLYDIVIRMLQRDRDRRYPSLDAAARDLRQWLDEHSRQVGAPEVAEWVEGLVGVELEERTRDISPTEGNFVVALHTPPPTSPTAATRLELPPRSRRRGAALGVGLAALVGVSAVGGSLLWEANEEPAVPPPAPAVPPTPVPPVEREAPAPSPPVAPRLTLQSKPEGASVLVGETLLGMTPLRLETLAPGAAHQLTLVKRGYVDAAVTVEPLAPGEERAVEVVLEVKPVPKAPPKGQRQKQPRPDASATASAGEDGYLTLRTTPWTKVTIDGEPYGTTPVFRRRLDPGTHDVLLENEEHGLKVRRKVQIKSGQNLKLDLDLSKP